MSTASTSSSPRVVTHDDSSSRPTWRATTTTRSGRCSESQDVQRSARVPCGTRTWASSGAGGRAGFETLVAPERWQAQVDEALRQALVNLDAVDCPAGEMDVVLGAGWPGVLLHEAIGHGFEGDFHRKGSSVFNGMMGQRVAAPGGRGGRGGGGRG